MLEKIKYDLKQRLNDGAQKVVLGESGASKRRMTALETDNLGRLVELNQIFQRFNKIALNK